MAFKIPAFVDAMDLSNDSIELKFGGDDFKMSHTSGQVNMYLTIFNLGTLIHTPTYIFTLATFKGI